MPCPRRPRIGHAVVEQIRQRDGQIEDNGPVVQVAEVDDTRDESGVDGSARTLYTLKSP